MAIKLPWWWSGVDGVLETDGRRLDQEAAPLGAELAANVGVGFRPTTLIFPSAGCWEVTGRIGEASLTFVTLVESLD